MIQEQKKEAGSGKLETGKSILLSLVFLCFLLSPFSFLPVSPVLAQSPEASNPNSPGFRLVVCDGPAALNEPSTHLIKTPDGSKWIVDPQWKPDPNFVPCNFRGLMIQARHLVNVMIILGVLAAIVGFSWAGGLYITGVEKNITRAHEIFKKVAIGFIIMLTAWFIVYQILSWLTGNPGLGVLLGSP